MLRATLLLLLAVRLEAASEYRVTIEVTGAPAIRNHPPQVYTVLVDGPHRRVLYEGRDGFLTNDGGKTNIYLDSKLKTWWSTDRPAIELTSGVPKVDAQLAPKIAAIPGFPLKTVFIATRAYAGGKPQVSTLTATVSDIRSVTPPPGSFEQPRDYKNQAPIVAAPGMNP
jgi:hypothetical protein